MNWVERFGNYAALGWLFLLWPPLDAYLRGKVPGLQGAVLAVALIIYTLIYAWYCLAGHRLRHRVIPVATVASLTVLAVVLDHLSGEAANNNFLIALLVAGFALPKRRALIAFFLVAAIMIVEGVLLAKLTAGQFILQLVLTLPSVVLFGGGAMGLRYLLASLAELRAARAEVAQHATDRERSRIARDLHDLLGHSLSLITLKGELATRLLPEGAPGVDEVRDMVALSREALQQVRDAVSGYRQPTLATELMAARVALRAAGMDLEVQQDVGALDRETEAVLGWVIREGCTNVIRHSGAKHCRIHLTRNPGELKIEVANDGWRVPQVPAGNGLRGLEERLSALGGTLDAFALPTAGFRLVATVPAQSRLQVDAVDAKVAR
ncbi:MAG: sensor histidine kinase [Chloroflexi bacterium]|nr:MAG: sensor histidine kinase [Chloroflexota bacterium]